MIYIKKQQHDLNKQSDTDLLADSYLPIINLPSPKVIPSAFLIFYVTIPPPLSFYQLVYGHLSSNCRTVYNSL